MRRKSRQNKQWRLWPHHALYLLMCVLLFGCATPSPSPGVPDQKVDLSGDWDYEEGGTVQRVSLDSNGNGTYRWQQGRIRTQSLLGHHWEGMWSQEGNDREGGFEVDFSPEGREGLGRWWYTRIGNKKDDTRDHGGTFRMKRVDMAAGPQDRG